MEPEPEPEPPAPDARHKTRNSWIVPVERQKRLMTIKECTTAEGKLSVMRNTKPRGTEHLKKQVRKLQAVNSINKKEGSK